MRHKLEMYLEKLKRENDTWRERRSNEMGIKRIEKDKEDFWRKSYDAYTARHTRRSDVVDMAKPARRHRPDFKNRELHEVRVFGQIWSCEVDMTHRDEPIVLGVQTIGDISEFLQEKVLKELESQILEEAS